jgi:diguanylate cyclase (GGDEF)-like protein
MGKLAKFVDFNVTAWLGRRSRLVRISLTVFSFAAVTVVLYIAPPDAHITALFLVPISFATWFLSPAAGWTGALLSSAALFIYEFQHHQNESGIIYLNAFLNVGLYSFIAFITTEIRALYKREQELSLHDSLTGLLNRRALTGALVVESRRLQRYHYPLTLAYIDIDDFKKVNDQLGHAAGDTYIRQMALVLKNTVRVSDFVARLGGDEFAVLLPETGPEAAQLTIAKVHESLLTLIQQRIPAVTVSVGAVTFETTADSPAEMIRMADEVMYEVKRSGKNRVAYKVFKAGTVWPASAIRTA